MTLRHDMLTAAKRAKPPLGDRAGLVARFLAGQIHDDGGFKGRGPDSDLYYTVFGLEALMALGADGPVGRIETYLSRFVPEDQDLVHLACLGRCLADAADCRAQAVDPVLRDALLRVLSTHRSADGGFAPGPGAQAGSAYGCFLAVGLVQDLGGDLQDGHRIAECIHSLQISDSGFTNSACIPVCSVPATAAAIAVLHYLGRPVPRTAVDFLVSQVHASGGLSAFPCPGRSIPPDLLSTATALHAFALIGHPLDSMRRQCLGFIEDLWDPQGGFRGTAQDPAVDCEYTYYGLLSLGHLTP